MDRHWDASGAAAAPAAPVNILGPNVYPQGGASPSEPGPWWFHMITEELRAVLVAAGETPDRGTLNQLVTAMQAQGYNLSLTAGTADAITVAFTPALTAFTSGPIWWRASAANATTTPTLKRDGLAAKTLVKGNGLALVPGDIPGAGAWMCSLYDATLDKEVLMNPATGIGGPSLSQQMIHVRDEKTSGTSGGSSIAGTQTRTLNTVVKNSITGASLASNQITLPAGTYRIDANAPSTTAFQHQASLYNVTDSVVALVGESEYVTNTANVQTRSHVRGEFTITGTKVFEFRHYTQSAVSSIGLGQTASSGLTEIYSNVIISKV